MISTRNLGELRGINELKKHLQSLATLDLIMSPEWEYRLYSFNSGWSESEQMGSMKSGTGDTFVAWFSKDGCFFKGFDHESEMSSWSTTEQKPWPNIYQGVPAELKEALKEPAFSIEDVSFCFSRLYGEESWNTGNMEFPESDDPDGSEYLLEILNGNPSIYQDFVEEYYEKNISLESIKHIYAHKPLTAEILEHLNPEVTLQSIEKEIIEIGYPSK
jgi:hypothetical protein